MGLFSSRQARQTPAADRSGAATATDPVQAARIRARRRLVGAAVLLGVGVVGFPLLFETQPRPIPVDIPIDIPRKDNAPSLPLPPPRVASATAPTPRVSSGVISERSAADGAPKRDGATSTAPPSAAKSADASPPATRPATGTSTAAAAKPSAPPAASTGGAAAASSAGAVPTDDGARAKALLEGKPVEPRSTAANRAADASVAAATPKSVAAPSAPSEPRTDAAAANGRFVVQVAAYSEAGAAREMRQRLEKLGLKSYTQVIEVDGAKRIRVRVGPFAARDEADKAAATLKGAGLPAAVLSL